MIKRKIMAMDYSFFITLPKYWAELNKIRKRDFVIMEITKEGYLVIKKDETAIDYKKA